MKFFLIGGVLLLGCSVCSIFAGSGTKEVTSDAPPADQPENSLQSLPAETEKDCKCSLIIPENILKNVPQEMQYTVFLQLIFSLVQTEYVKKISECEIVEKAITGVLAALDPHSSYLNEKAFAALKNQTEGEFGGLGIEMVIDEGFIRIISPIDDTPAYKAELKGGDLIIYIDDEYINGITAEEALQKLRGKPGTKVKLKIKRGNKLPFDVQIVRDIIKVESVKAEIVDYIGYIRISTFDKNTTESIKKFVVANQRKGQKLNGIVLDLRNNPGGLLDAAVSTANIFLNRGKIVSIRGRTSENSKTFHADGKDLTNGVPLVALINSGTASAPEILAGALRDNKRAIIVGVRSFGKGSVQKIIPLSEKTAIRITVAKHYTPSGECIQANGIAPDIVADYAIVKKPESLFTIREESFNNALDANEKARKLSEDQNKKALDDLAKLKNKKLPDDEEEDHELVYRKLPLRERLEQDYQLGKAFDIIRTITKFKQIGLGK
ncbi:MAG: S41 family peptidase [Holosporaceae bacterium]|jgi:carboxyl-terminal processing protease|nr:S41 family peptidase [Holosporaceae bacterium]